MSAAPTGRDPELLRLIRELGGYPTFTGGLYKMRILHERRASTTPGLDAGLPAKFAAHLARTGLQDPTAATTAFERSAQLVAESRRAVADDGGEDLGGALATGKLDASAGAVRERLAKRPPPEEVARLARETRVTLEHGAHRSLLAGLQAIFDYGEAKWIGVLEPIVSDALDRGDDELWNAAHAFARWLRDPLHSRVFGLSALVDDGRSDADTAFFAFGDPAGPYRWRLAKAAASGQVRAVAHFTDPRGVSCAVFAFKRDAPTPRLRDFEPSWRPGLFTAEQVLANIAALRKAEDLELDGLAPKVEPAPMRRPARATFNG